MIEVLLLNQGKVMDSAEAEDPAGAVLAARTLWDELRDHLSGLSHAHMEAWFLVDGKLIRKIDRRDELA